MRWGWRCVLDNWKGILPFRNQLRELKWRFRPYRRDSERDTVAVQQGLRQIEWARSIRPIESLAVMEIGSGWQPLIPVLFSLAGATRVLVTDLNPLCSPATWLATLDALAANRSLILEGLGVSEAALDEALTWEPSWSLNEVFRRLRLEYWAPCDCRKMDLPDGSLDLITSRAVLEHIPPEVIREIFLECRRLLRQGALMCHVIDNSDHWAHRDGHISKVNFLKYPDAVFRWTYLNALNYQNRLRHPEYIEILDRAGFDIVREERVIDPAALVALSTLPLSERFRRFSTEDLATVTSFVMASPRSTVRTLGQAAWAAEGEPAAPVSPRDALVEHASACNGDTRVAAVKFSQGTRMKANAHPRSFAVREAGAWVRLSFVGNSRGSPSGLACLNSSCSRRDPGCRF